MPRRRAADPATTPLLQTVLVAAPRRRAAYPHRTCRRFCSVACSSLLVAGFVFFALHALVLWPRHLGHGHGRSGHYALSRGLDHARLRSLLLNTPAAARAREWNSYYSSGPHLAGRNRSQAEWTRDKWQSWGVDASLVAYDVYINYPVSHGLALLRQNTSAAQPASWAVAFNASLTEDALPEDPTTGLADRIPTFHGYSASGNVTAPFVFVNYGTYQDYEDLLDAGIRLKGLIAVAKYGRIFRGLKVKRAQELGMVGVVMYSDPGDDGQVTEEHGYEPYPKGPARNPSSVQRGSVQFLTVRPGDPSTPGYPSKPGAPRAPVHDSTPSIPSLPISYADATPILSALNGHGPKAADLGEPWTKHLGLSYKGVDYNIGPSPDGVVLNLVNQQNYTTTPVWNVIGVINGTMPNEVVIVGNHRDAWIAGGAADPNSGSAVLNEVIRSVGKAVEAGWKPLRTIIFASWDGEEHALIGSTEWVEEYIPWLTDANVAYVNVDVAVAGPNFKVAAAPLLHQVLRDATRLVPSPNQTIKGQTVGDVWNGEIRVIGSGSDFTAFQDFAGVPSIDMGFKPGPGSPVYHYHSNYDSLHWMDERGDPGFQYHEAMAKVLGVVLGELSDAIVIPLGAADYAAALNGYLDQVEDKLRSARAQHTAVADDEARGGADALEKALERLRASLAALGIKAAELDGRAAWARRTLDEGLPWWNIIGKIRLWMTIARVNSQLKHLERRFIFAGGLDGRNWYKHVVFAPGLWTGYSGAVYPGLVESIDAKDYNNGLRWAGIIDGCVVKATQSIS